MKQRIFSALLAVCLIMVLLPGTAFAAAAVPSGNGNNFFANGTAITIADQKPDDAQDAILDGFTATGTDAYIIWEESGVKKTIGVDGTKVSVYGGSDGSAAPVTVSSTSIIMTGGKIHNLFGGNLGMKDADAAHTSRVTGDVDISVSGSGLVRNLLHGGGEYNDAVDGTATITLTGVDFTVPEGYDCYVNGGVYGNGNEGIRDIDNGTMTTNAVVKRAVINVTDSKVYLIAGGGSGSTKVGSAEVNIADSAVDYLYLGGINGVTEQSDLTVTGASTIGSLAGTNRGFVGNATADIGGSTTIDKWATGAAEGCFSSDSGSKDGSGITGSIAWNLGSGVSVTEAKLTPSVINDNGDYNAEVGGITINKEGDPVQLEAAGFSPRGGTTVMDFGISSDKSLALSGAQVTIPANVSVSNQGTIAVGENAALKAQAGSTLTIGDGATLSVEKGGSLDTQEATVTNNGKIDVQPGGKVEDDSLAGDVTYYITVTAGEGGSISPAPDAAGTVPAALGSSKAFTVTPNEGYKIAAVKVDGVSVTLRADNTYTIEVKSADHSIEATFEKVATAGTEDPDVDESDIPQTGDEGNLALWTSLLLLGGMAAVGMAFFLRRKAAR